MLTAIGRGPRSRTSHSGRPDLHHFRVNSMTRDSFGIAQLLSPMDPRAFLDTYWERAPLLLARDDPGHHRSLFSTADVDALLSQSRPRYPQLRVVKKGEGFPLDGMAGSGWLNPVVPHRDFDAKIAPIYRFYADGYTVIVEMEKLW